MTETSNWFILILTKQRSDRFPPFSKLFLLTCRVSLSKVLSLSANICLDSKKLARDKLSSSLSPSSANNIKRFIPLTPDVPHARLRPLVLRLCEAEELVPKVGPGLRRRLRVHQRQSNSWVQVRVAIHHQCLIKKVVINQFGNKAPQPFE